MTNGIFQDSSVGVPTQLGPIGVPAELGIGQLLELFSQSTHTIGLNAPQEAIIAELLSNQNVESSGLIEPLLSPGSGTLADVKSLMGELEVGSLVGDLSDKDSLIGDLNSNLRNKTSLLGQAAAATFAAGSLVVIDPSVANYQSFAANVAEGAETILLDPSDNEVVQIGDKLEERKRRGIETSSIHIVSHGKAGKLFLGSSVLDADYLSTHKDQLASWSKVLSPDADILLYGCDVAAGDSGQAFVQQLSHLTDADVAASDDLTGNSDLGGNWNLEVKTGVIEADLAFDSKEMETYNAVLKAPLAFPTAEGFGAQAKGGRGGKVIFVDNLNDSGSGSLRAALEAKGPRTVVFRTGGTIELKRGIKITNPYLTIAGQTAPGDGITIKSNGKHAQNLIEIKTHDVIMRYIRVRTGKGPSAWQNGIKITDNSHDIIIDHVSASWTGKGLIATWGRVNNVTVQKTIMSESIGPKRAALNGNGADRVTLYQNLFAHNAMRNPVVKNYSGKVNPPAGFSPTFEVINNIVYNWGKAGIQIGAFSGEGWNPNPTKVNVIGNYFKAGPSSPKGSGNYSEIVVMQGDPHELYVRGNIGPHRPNNSKDEWANVGIWGSNKPAPRKYQISKPHNSPLNKSGLLTQKAYDLILEGAGASLVRDSVDKRIVNEVKTGTGRIIDDPSKVGGWPKLAKGTPPADRDKDGMPDAWEKQYGFNPNDPNDRNGDADKDGYTNLEEYLNELAGDQPGGGNSGGGNSGGGNSGGGSNQSPFGSKPWAINDGARIQAENFDKGGPGVAYKDTDSSNKGGQYRRSEGVDIAKANDVGGGYNLGYLRNGEWLEYTTNVTGGKYDIKIRVASGNSNPGDLRLKLGNKVLGSFNVKNTGGWQKWRTLTLKDVNLAGGNNQNLRLEVVGGNFNVNWLDFEKVASTQPPSDDKQSPFGGKPQIIKNGARIQAENFDNGGPGIAYKDTDSSNKGGQYRRSEGVDIAKANDVGGGYNLGYLRNGEWLEYTTNVTGGKYDIKIRVASGNSNPGNLRLKLGNKVLGSFDVKNTGGWQKWRTLTLKGVNLAGGKDQLLRLEVGGGNFNLNWLEFDYKG